MRTASRCGKLAYSSKKDAQTAINSIMFGKRRKNRRNHRPENGLRMYYCNWCDGWHLSKGREQDD